MRDDFDSLTNFNGVSTRGIIDPGPRNWGGFFCCAGACPKNDDEQYQKDEWSLTLHMKLPKERLREWKLTVLQALCDFAILLIDNPRRIYFDKLSARFCI